MLHLSDDDRNEFLYLQKQLILFTNKKLKLYPNFKTLEDIHFSNTEDLKKKIFPTREKMYEVDNLKDFCDKTCELSDFQREIVKAWSTVYSDNFYVLKHLQNETILLTGDEEKLYGVLGISDGLDDFFPEPCLPILIITKLIPFKQKIICDGFFSTHNVSFGGNIRRRLKQRYSEIKGEQGIISHPEAGVLLKNQTPNKPENEMISFSIKKDLKNNLFPNKAWELAKKSEESRYWFEQEYAKYFSKYQKSSLEPHKKEIKTMHYAMYRGCVVGVSETKRSLVEFCTNHYPEIAKYIYIFKA